MNTAKEILAEFQAGVTVTQLAERLSLSVATIERYCKQRYLPPFDFQRRRWRVSTIARWLAFLSQQPRTAQKPLYNPDGTPRYAALKP